MSTYSANLKILEVLDFVWIFQRWFNGCGNIAYRVVFGVITGVLLVDTLEYFKSIVVVTAFHHEFRAFGEVEEPETEKE